MNKITKSINMYTAENILNLMVTRGGIHQYKLVHISTWDVEIKSSGGKGRSSWMNIAKVLDYLNKGKWQVVTETANVKLYEIY